MHPVLKRDASPDVIASVQKVEDQSDSWFSNLAISTFPQDLAVWAVLTQVVIIIEGAAESFGFGSQRHRETMINLGRCVPLLLDTLGKQSLPKRNFLLRWTPELSASSNAAIIAAAEFETFVGCFTLWHLDRAAVQIISPTHLRFVTSEEHIRRRVRAYQQGARVAGWPSTVDQPIDKDLVDDPTVKQLLQNLWPHVALTGALAMEYADDEELLALLQDIYTRRLASVFRREPTLTVGGYTLETFREFFAALMAFCSVHEHLCFAWAKAHGRYPMESAVLVKPRQEWIDSIAKISRLPKSAVTQVTADLTLGTISPVDLYLHPFVPSEDGSALLLIPHLVLNSRAEENLLRVWSYLQPRSYSAIQNSKENEMRIAIRDSVGREYNIRGPIKLPNKTLPDIDLIATEPGSSTVLLGELKWLRKPLRVREHVERDSEIEHGIQQLRNLRAYLDEHPEVLRTKLNANEGCEPLYCLVARDHMMWAEPEQNLWIVEFDALIWSLQKSRTLHDAIITLRSYEWLPKEGEDFSICFEKFFAGGVTIEAEVVHRTPAGGPSGTIHS